MRTPWQVHVIQLIREAVLNAIKHAQASEIKISCHQHNKLIDINIKDNGVGFLTSVEKVNHYGLTIMSERADRLNGELNVISNLGEGCTVQLHFPLQM